MSMTLRSMADMCVFVPGRDTFHSMTLDEDNEEDEDEENDAAAGEEESEPAESQGESTEQRKARCVCAKRTVARVLRGQKILTCFLPRHRLKQHSSRHWFSFVQKQARGRARTASFVTTATQQSWQRWQHRPGQATGWRRRSGRAVRRRGGRCDAAAA